MHALALGLELELEHALALACALVGSGPRHARTLWVDGPGLPADVLRMIWQRVWRDDAARLVQRAVRAKVVRARGDLWNLPGLVAPDDLFMWDAIQTDAVQECVVARGWVDRTGKQTARARCEAGRGRPLGGTCDGRN